MDSSSEIIRSKENVAAAEDANSVDIALMQRAQNDDRSAFAEIISRHQRSLMNYFGRTGVYSDVEDLAQETFIRLYKYRTHYKPTAKFTTFLYLLARQVRIDFLRKSSRRDALHERAGAEIPESVEPAAAERGERIDVEEALRRLPDAMREVVVLAVMQGLSRAEISEIMGIPVGTVKSRLSIALQRIKDTMNIM